MATLAQIMAVRKSALKIIKLQMKALDSIQESTERFIERLLKRRRKLPTTTELDAIVKALTAVDRRLDKTLGATQNAVTIYKQSADLADLPTGQVAARMKNYGITTEDIRKIGKDLSEFFNMVISGNTPGVGINRL